MVLDLFIEYISWSVADERTNYKHFYIIRHDIYTQTTVNPRGQNGIRDFYKHAKKTFS